MKHSVLMLALAGSLVTTAAQADTLLGLYIGADGWRTSTDGSFANNEQLQSFNFNDKTQSSYYVALEHPLPLLPNIRLQHNQLESNGLTVLNASFSFAGETFAVDTDIANQVDLTNTDYVLYYEILDNDLVSLDLGINAKHIDGSVAVADLGGSGAVAVQDASTFIPMLYTSAIVGLPLTGLELFANGSFVSYDGSRVYDMQAGVAYALLDNLAVDLRLKLGYRAVNLRLDDIDNLYADLDFKGAFAGIELHF
ncbi:TIGR04219 family outer membrane beta-barrel protein [Rheinheimera fenheensis]|uniref:TIGR04219 family outer membrane beta-barrel protein n=1 Tax=Rheinheimera fenheensis TaxID=3152295 RepID=UPI00325F36D0